MILKKGKTKEFEAIKMDGTVRSCQKIVAKAGVAAQVMTKTGTEEVVMLILKYALKVKIAMGQYAVFDEVGSLEVLTQAEIEKNYKVVQA